MSKECPACGCVNFWETLRCDCGFHFPRPAQGPTNKTIPEPGTLFEDLETHLGPVEAAFSTSPGQTSWGIMAGVVIAIVGLLYSTFDIPTWAAVIVSAAITIIGLGLAYWVWRLRKWKLLVCADGVVQTGAWRTQTLRWADVIEVVETRSQTPTGALLGVCLVGAGTKIVVGGLVNYRSWGQGWLLVLEAARRRGVPVRIEVDTSQD